MKLVDAFSTERGKLVYWAKGDEDAVQELAADLVKAGKINEPIHYGFLRKACRSAARDNWRDEQRHATRRYNLPNPDLERGGEPDDEYTVSIPQVIWDREGDLRIDVLKALSMLTPKQRMVMANRILGYTFREIAAMDGTDESNVRQVYRYAQREMRKQLA